MLTMANDDRRPDGLFPRDVLGRIVLGVCGALFLPVMGAILFALWFRVALPQDALQWVIRLAGTAFAGAIGGYFVCGLVWAIAKPRRMEPHLARIARGVTRVVTLALAVALGAFLIVIVAPILFSQW